MDSFNSNTLIFRRIIIDHYSNPNHLVKNFNDDTYITKYIKSQSCIDEITLYIKIHSKKIVDYKFSGYACSICVAATDIIGDIIINKNIDYAILVIENYFNLINNIAKNIDRKLLFELICLQNTYKLPARKKCALLSSTGLLEILLDCK